MAIKNPALGGAGFNVSADDLENAQSELSGEELESVAGSAGGIPSHSAGPFGCKVWPTGQSVC